MRRLRPIIVSSMTILSAVMAMSLLALMVRSFFHEDWTIGDGPGFEGDRARWLFLSDAGRVDVERVSYRFAAESSGRTCDTRQDWWHHGIPSSATNDRRLDNLYAFEIGKNYSTPRTVGLVTIVQSGFSFTVPHWFAIVIFAIAPAIWLVRRRRTRRLKTEGFWPAMATGSGVTKE